MKRLTFFIPLLILIICSCTDSDQSKSTVTIVGSWNAISYKGHSTTNYSKTYISSTGQEREEANVQPSKSDNWNTDLIYGRNVWIMRSNDEVVSKCADISNVDYTSYIEDKINNRLLFYKRGVNTPEIYQINEINREKLVVGRQATYKELISQEDYTKDGESGIVKTYGNVEITATITFNRIN